ncbi:MAG: Ig domain protein group 2 domain protein [Parcubacteria group bacterium GW2011_GWF2_38_76]|nr:MAG: Ig domain protein group 2 domain protein [Parcubacteria group bacterium GW2011_GWF2_38_76]HBM45802.1 hypothetical protein [Patescibacteria group bacterium]
MKKFIVVIILLCMSVVFIKNISASGPTYLPGNILINEFMTSTDVGVSQWYELINTTEDNINLTEWVLSSAVNGEINIATILDDDTIPAYGIVVIDTAYNPADDFGDVLQLKDPTAQVIHAVSYGDQPEPAEPNHTDAPTVGSTVALISGVWGSAPMPTKGWFNDAIDWTCEQINGIDSPEVPPTLSSVATCLSSEMSLETNLGEGSPINPSAFSSLYFRIPGMGMITFNDNLNLSDQNTVTVIRSLADKLMMSTAGTVGLNPDACDPMSGPCIVPAPSVFKNVNATVEFYGVNALGFYNVPPILVKDDEGVIIPSDDPSYPTITNLSYDGGQNDGTVYLTTNHFTQFTLDNSVYVDDDFSGDGSEANPFATIAEGVANVPEGGIVHVAAGSYDGNILIDRSMTIQGVSSTTITVTAPLASHGFDVSADNVTISGFTITGATGGGGGGKAGININSGVDNLTISDNIIAGNMYGIKTKGAITALNVQNNSINNNSYYGIYIIKVVGDLTVVADWTLQNNSFENDSYNIYREGTTGTLNAENNYWGWDNRAYVKNSIYYVSNNGGVDFVPFYTDEERTTLSDLYFTFDVGADEMHTYFSIQDAINEADCEASTTGTSNIITVGPGYYSETISMTKSVDLRGPNSNINPITDERADEAILDGVLPLIQMTTNGVANVTINGFKLVGATDVAVAGAIYSNKLNAHNITIRDNIFSGSQGRSIFTSQGEEGVYRNNWLITENVFENVGSVEGDPFQAAMMIQSIEGSSITNNQIDNTSYGGIQLGHSSSTIISGNSVSNVPRSGIQVAYSTGITVTGNTITNAGNGEEMVDVRGFGVHTDDTTENGGITFYNYDQPNITVTNNTISGSYNGIAIRSVGTSELGNLGEDILINENSITGSLNFAVENLAPSGQLSAEHNYWGSSLPDFGTIMSGSVDYNPWWTTASGPDVVSSSNKDISSFSISSQVGTTTINQTTHTVSMVVPFGTDVTAFSPTITHTGLFISPSGGTAQDFTTPQTYTVTAIDSSTQEYTVSVEILSDTQTAPNDSGSATASSTKPQVVIKNPTQEVSVSIESGTIEPSIDVSAFITDGVGDIPKITITSANAGNAVISIPPTTITSASTTWNGILAAPTVTSVTLPETSGETKTLSTAIEVGFSGVKLSFDKGVRILLPSQAGKRVGYIRTGIEFTEITATCSSDSQSAGDALVADGDCKIDVGSDLVIWTKHFTSFASYTQTTNTTTPSSGGGGIAGSGPTAVGYVVTYPPSLVQLAPKQMSEMTIEELKAEIYRLTVLLQSLRTQIEPLIIRPYGFAVNLAFGSKNEDVRNLQKVLNSDLDTAVALSGAGSSGNETNFFGTATRVAVLKFQKKYGIAQTGFVGPLTRAKLQELFGTHINN